MELSGKQYRNASEFKENGERNASSERLLFACSEAGDHGPGLTGIPHAQRSDSRNMWSSGVFHSIPLWT